MSTSDIILVIISGLGVVHGVFLAIFLWSYTKGNILSNRILSILLLVLSFRVGKSVFLEFADNLDVKMIFIGLGTLMAIGPLFYFFVRSCVNKEFQFRKIHLTHFVPSLLGVCFGFWLNQARMDSLPVLIFFFLFIGYYMHYVIYLMVSYSLISKNKASNLNRDTYQFLRLLFFGLMIVWVAYVLNLFDELIPYIVSPILYSVVAYTISFIAIRKGYILKD